jgi:hypothetical protein
MAIGTVQLSGRVRFAPPAPAVDGSSNPTLLSDIIEDMACSGSTSGTYTLVADGDTSVSFGGISSAGLVVVKVTPNVGIPPSPGFPNGVPAAPNPVVVKLTSAAGTAQAISVDGFMLLLSSGVPYTAVSLARTPSVQTVVRIQLFAPG